MWFETQNFDETSFTDLKFIDLPKKKNKKQRKTKTKHVYIFIILLISFHYININTIAKNMDIRITGPFNIES